MLAFPWCTLNFSLPLAVTSRNPLFLSGYFSSFSMLRCSQMLPSLQNSQKSFQASQPSGSTLTGLWERPLSSASFQEFSDP